MDTCIMGAACITCAMPDKRKGRGHGVGWMIQVSDLQSSLLVWLPVWVLLGDLNCTPAMFPVNLIAKYFTKEHKHARVIVSCLVAYTGGSSRANDCGSSIRPSGDHHEFSETLLQQRSALSYNKPSSADGCRRRGTMVLLGPSA